MLSQKTTSVTKLLWGKAGALLALLCFAVVAQAQAIDRLDAIVGDDVILHSEIQAQIQYYEANGLGDDGSMYCRVMEEKIFDRLLLNKAKQDSIEVSEAEVTGELERRLAYFIQGYGGVDKVEEIYGKPLIEIKADLRDEVKEKLLVDRMRQSIISKINVTPRDVKKFFSEIPKDSLPLLPAEVEIHHLAILPKASEKSIDLARQQLVNIRNKVVNKEESFEEMAKKHSRDPGSAQIGGDLGTFGRGKMVPEFEEMAFKTKVGEYTEIFETPYGFHFMYVYDRVGEEVSAKHILITALINPVDDSLAMARLKEIRTWVTETDTLEFEIAASKYSDDASNKSYGGAIRNPQTGDSRVPIDQLDAGFFFIVDDLKEGEVSEPSEWFTPDNKRGFHIVSLKRRVPPHIANLEEDYYKIQQAALQAKQSTALEAWFKRAVRNIYIDIKNEECIGVLPYLIPDESQ